MLAKAQFRSTTRSISGMAVITLDPSATSCWPRIKWLATAQALTRCRQPLAVALGLRRAALPSIAMGTSPQDWHRAAIQLPKQAANLAGLRAAKTRRKVSWEGMPLGKARKRL